MAKKGKPKKVGKPNVEEAEAQKVGEYDGFSRLIYTYNLTTQPRFIEIENSLLRARRRAGVEGSDPQQINAMLTRFWEAHRTISDMLMLADKRVLPKAQKKGASVETYDIGSCQGAYRKQMPVVPKVRLSGALLKIRERYEYLGFIRSAYTLGERIGKPLASLSDMASKMKEETKDDELDGWLDVVEIEISGITRIYKAIMDCVVDVKVPPVVSDGDVKVYDVKAFQDRTEKRRPWEEYVKAWLCEEKDRGWVNLDSGKARENRYERGRQIIKETIIDGFLTEKPKTDSQCIRLLSNLLMKPHPIKNTLLLVEAYETPLAAKNGLDQLLKIIHEIMAEAHNQQPNFSTDTFTESAIVSEMKIANGLKHVYEKPQNCTKKLALELKAARTGKTGKEKWRETLQEFKRAAQTLKSIQENEQGALL